MAAIDKLQQILDGEFSFYFSFNRILLYKGNELLMALDESNCEDPTSVFKRGGMVGGIYAGFDIFDDDAWSKVQSFGAFRGMYSGFNFALDLYGWRKYTDEPYSIIYPLHNGGFDSIVLIAMGECVTMQINSQGYSLVLVDVWEN